MFGFCFVSFWCAAGVALLLLLLDYTMHAVFAVGATIDSDELGVFEKILCRSWVS